MKFLKNSIIMLALTLGLLVGVNLCAGLIARNYYFKLDTISKDSQQESFGYFVANQTRTIIFPGLKPYQVNINDLGLRTVGVSQTVNSIKDQFKVLCAGDSNTFGLFVDDESSYPYQLQKLFSNNNQNVAVLNAGIGSTSIHDYLYYLKVKGLSLKPDVVILNFTINDLYELERTMPYYEEFLNNTASPFKEIFEHSNIGRAFRKVYVWHKYKRWLRKIKDPRARAILKNQNRDKENLIYFAQVHHNAEILSDPHMESAKALWEKYFDYLDQTVSVLKEQNVSLIYNIHPEVLALLGSKENNKYKEVLFDYLKKNNIEYLDVYSILENEKDIISIFNNPPRDFHLNQKGNDLLAKALYEKIQEIFLSKKAY